MRLTSDFVSQHRERHLYILVRICVIEMPERNFVGVVPICVVKDGQDIRSSITK